MSRGKCEKQSQDSTSLCCKVQQGRSSNLLAYQLTRHRNRSSYRLQCSYRIESRPKTNLRVSAFLKQMKMLKPQWEELFSGKFSIWLVYSQGLPSLCVWGVPRKRDTFRVNRTAPGEEGKQQTKKIRQLQVKTKRPYNVYIFRVERSFAPKCKSYIKVKSYVFIFSKRLLNLDHLKRYDIILGSKVVSEGNYRILRKYY